MRYRKLRQAWNETGDAHFLTYSCYGRIPLLRSPRAKQWVIDAIIKVRQTHEVEIWAYVVMPDHVHVLLHPRSAKYEMRRILAALKWPVAVAARKYLERLAHCSESSCTLASNANREVVQDETPLPSSQDRMKARRLLQRLTVSYPSRSVFRFWLPGGGFDRNICRERPIRVIADYIHGNPVRRGLIACTTDWEWSSARAWEGESDVPIRIDNPFG